MFKEIADYLLNIDKEKATGLLVGNAGVSLFLYQVYRKTGQTEFEETADIMLNNILEKQTMLSSTNFRDGLAGLGWGIEFLLQNNFYEGDPEEILEDVDNVIFKSIYEARLPLLGVNEGLCGYLLYLNSRIRNKKRSNSVAHRINCELIKVLINKIDKIAPEHFQSLTKDIHFDLLWEFPALLVVLRQSLDLNLYNEKIINMVNQWMVYLGSYLPSMHCHRLSLLLALYSINTYIHSIEMEQHIKVLAYSIDFNKLKSEVDPYAINIMHGWPGVVCLLSMASQYLNADYPNYHLFDKTRCEILHQYLNGLEEQIDNLSKGISENKSISIGIVNGITGIGIIDLCYPEVMSVNSNK